MTTTTRPGTAPQHTIIVEHLDPELEDWQALEYKCIADECHASNTHFILSGLKSTLAVHKRLDVPTANRTNGGVEDMYTTPSERQRVCLLDPKAEHDLSPDDGELFDVFLFGGILGDDPPRDRTGDLRKLEFPGRRLGKEQMTTDTAARVTRMVVRDKQRLEDIPFIDRPEIELPLTASGEDGTASSESVSMPFKYVRREDGTPIMPKGMLELLAKDADKDIMDLL